ncbi:PPE family protein [Mycobacterium haemophilum DSM 44634]|uniref:PPE family protein n=1 Tax=Mycobacterium haemophilum TaxID=29311 RepID=UPI000655E184|nr:PPE family protein [Mycobacterium haemophilum]AKN16437.1 hypothetical protein B586_07480 [Mycobacterium haemophilum DSM 44634]MCV7341458.1 PPE family protein [Mycobacterium haemophilum DSM 44634]
MPDLRAETITNYTRVGPGPASMQRAADEWGSLSEELLDFKSSFNQMLVSLTEEWSGPVAMQMIEATKPFLTWLDDLGQQLVETQNQIERIIRGYWRAHRDVVPPTAIRGNLTRRAQLLNNPLGVNTYGITLLDQQYQQFCTHNGQVWNRYRARLADASSRLAPWPSPPSITNNTESVQPVRTDTSVSGSSASSSG